MLIQYHAITYKYLSKIQNTYISCNTMQIPNNSYNKKQYDEASRRHMRLHDAMGGLTATTENLIHITLGRGCRTRSSQNSGIA